MEGLFWETWVKSLREDVRLRAQERGQSEREVWEEVYRDPHTLALGARFPLTVQIAAYLALKEGGHA